MEGERERKMYISIRFVLLRPKFIAARLLCVRAGFLLRGTDSAAWELGVLDQSVLPDLGSE